MQPHLLQGSATLIKNNNNINKGEIKLKENDIEMKLVKKFTLLLLALLIHNKNKSYKLWRL